MQLDGPVSLAIAESHAMDRQAYESLGAYARWAARRCGTLLLSARRFLVWFSHWVLRGSERLLGVALEWLLWLGDKVLFGPYRVVVRAIVGIGQAVTAILKQLAGAVIGLFSLVLGAIDQVLGFAARRLSDRPRSSAVLRVIVRWRQRLHHARRRLRILRRAIRRAIDRGWQNLRDQARNAVLALGRGIDWFTGHIMFRPLAWLFNPRLPGGRPLFLHEGVTRLAGFLLAALALYLGAAVLAYIKAKALMLHATINMELWSADASPIRNVVIIGAAHAAISISVAASKFVLLPVLAAARRGIKNNRYTQAIAYRYVRRLRAVQRRDAWMALSRPQTPAPKPRASLKFVETLIRHIIAGTVPETYEVKIRNQQGGATAMAG